LEPLIVYINQMLVQGKQGKMQLLIIEISSLIRKLMSSFSSSHQRKKKRQKLLK